LLKIRTAAIRERFFSNDSEALAVRIIFANYFQTESRPLGAWRRRRRIATRAHHHGTPIRRKVAVAVVDVTATVIAQVLVFSVALTETDATNKADAEKKGTSTKNHAVPSLAIAQSSVAVLVTGKNRLVAAAVLGVVDWYLYVTFLVEPIDHAPVNVQTRKTFPDDPPERLPKVSPAWSRSPASTSRTTFAIRSAAGRVKVTRSVLADFPSGFWAILEPSACAALNSV
jgi:hypothetical protein